LLLGRTSCSHSLSGLGRVDRIGGLLDRFRRPIDSPTIDSVLPWSTKDLSCPRRWQPSFYLACFFTLVSGSTASRLRSVSPLPQNRQRLCFVLDQSSTIAESECRVEGDCDTWTTFLGRTPYAAPGTE
jgi:hypothetical protein